MRLPACENVTNAELFDEAFALAGSCNGRRTYEDLSPHRQVLNPLSEQNLPLISISLLGP